MLNHILAALNDHVLAFNRDKEDYLFISNMLGLTGHDTDAFHKNTDLWDELIEAADREQVTSATAKLTEGDHINLTYRIITASGKRIWVKDKRSLFADGQTGDMILLSIVKDVQREEEAKYNHEESMAGYSILFDNNPNPMWIYEISTLRILKINEAAIKTYGYTEDEFLSMTITDLRPASEHANFNDFINSKGITSAKFHGFNPSGIWKHINKKGEIIYAEINGDSIHYKNYDCRIIVATNITEKLHYQEQVKLREQFLNSLIDSQTNFLLRIDINGLYTFANKQFLKKFGYKAGEITGRHFTITSVPEETLLCEAAFSNCISHPGKVTHLTHKKIAKSGAVFDTEWEFITITDEKGNITGVQGIGQDITDKRNAQKEITWTKNNLEALINNTEDLIWSIDCENRYLYMNQAYKNAILFYTGSIPQKGDNALHSVFDEQLLNEWRQYYNRAFKGEAYVIVDERPDTVTGQNICFEMSFNPIYNSEGVLTGVGCFGRNITERIKINKAIIDQNERLKNIASLSSHDLRRPVATMLGLINILDKENFYNPENKEIIEHLFCVGGQIDEVIRLIVDNTFTDTIA